MNIKLIAFCLLLSLTGCDFGNNSEGFDNPKDDCHSYLTATVDGERFNAEVCKVYEWNYVANAPHIIISGSTSDLRRSIVLEIFDLR